MNFNEKINAFNWSESYPKPNLPDFRKAGYGVEIVHNRRHKVAYRDFNTGKLIVKVVMNYVDNVSPVIYTDSLCLSELLAKGGITEITVTDPETKTDFYAKSICRDDENYNRAAGVEKCLSRVYDLMTVCDGQDGFKMKF